MTDPGQKKIVLLKKLICKVLQVGNCICYKGVHIYTVVTHKPCGPDTQNRHMERSIRG